MRWHVASFCAALLTASTVQATELKPSGSPSVAGYLPVGADEQGIWDQANEIERTLKVSKSVVRDEALNAYLRRVLCRTVGADGCKAARIYVVRESSFNAGAYPNGVIVVNTGALLRIQDEAELAALLGHEFGHFEYRHQLANLKSTRNTASWSVWLSVVSIGVGGGVDYSPALWAGHFRHSRDQERAADVAGLQFMATAGYRTSRAGDIWAQQRDEEDSRSVALGVSSRKDSYRGPFASHPMDLERMNYLREDAKTVGVGNSFDGASEYRTSLASVWPMLIDDQMKLNDFGGSEFLLDKLAANGWTGPLLYARGELYRRRAKDGDLPLAADFYRRATQSADAPPAAWRGLGLTLARNGDVPGAKAAITEYLTRNPQAGDRETLLMIGAN